MTHHDVTRHQAQLLLTREATLAAHDGRRFEQAVGDGDLVAGALICSTAPPFLSSSLTSLLSTSRRGRVKAAATHCLRVPGVARCRSDQACAQAARPHPASRTSAGQGRGPSVAGFASAPSDPGRAGAQTSTPWLLRLLRTEARRTVAIGIFACDVSRPTRVARQLLRAVGDWDFVWDFARIRGAWPLTSEDQPKR
jgi:hypothetical protein